MEQNIFWNAQGQSEIEDCKQNLSSPIKQGYRQDELHILSHSLNFANEKKILPCKEMGTPPEKMIS